MEKIIIIDSNSVIHRAFHALPPLTNSKGEVVNAVYGYLTFLFKAIKEFQPDYIAACFDVSKSTFRTKLFDGYKAKREKAPDELYLQIPKVKEILHQFNIPVFEKEGYEGDDLIGTIAKHENGNLEKVILSGDLDNLQLINETTKVFFLKRGVKDTSLFDIKKVEEKYDGLTPKDLIELKGLKGDMSDNIPGVLGIGEITAIKLIKKYKNIDELYEHLDEIEGKLKEKLEVGKVNAFLSRELGRIKTDVPINFELEKCKWGEYEKTNVVSGLEELGFKSLIAKIPGESRGDNLTLL